MREKSLVTYKEASLRLSANFSAISLYTKKQWDNIFLKNTINQEDYIQHKCLQNQRRKNCPNKQKLREFIAARPNLEEMVKTVLPPEAKGQ